MKISVVAVGGLKEAYWRLACAEYIKRLGVCAKTAIIEIAEEKAPDRPSAADVSRVLQKEGSRILQAVGAKDYVVALCVEGRHISSEEMAALLETGAVEGAGRLTFIIGGSFGLSPDVKNRANVRLSFSQMTFPHQLARVMLLEQIYRGFKITRKEPYHK